MSVAILAQGVLAQVRLFARSPCAALALHVEPGAASCAMWTDGSGAVRLEPSRSLRRRERVRRAAIRKAQCSALTLKAALTQSVGISACDQGSQWQEEEQVLAVMPGRGACPEESPWQHIPEVQLNVNTFIASIIASEKGSQWQQAL